MKTGGLLHADLNAHVARLAHTDLFAVADSGFPVAPCVPVVDLRLVFGVPRFEQVLAALLQEVTVEHALVAAEMGGANPAAHAAVAAVGIPIDQVPHEELKRQAAGARFVVRSAEDTPYANVLLRAGVAFL